jgi:phosphoribosylformimino-5-aminoimidazole carboxamide ribotide isomerase
MLIPSIDLQGGAVVQLIQGERLAIRDEDVFAWVRRFAKFPKVQVIDLDAATGNGDNLSLVRTIAAAIDCRVGGGARLFTEVGPDLPFARTLSGAIGRDRLIGAVDSRNGHVVVHGWKTELPLTAVEAVRALEPFCDEFLYTHVDTEGLMGGTNIDAILAVTRATSRRITAAGGITTQEEIDELDALGIDAVVGMAIYTGKLQVPGSR